MCVCAIFQVVGLYRLCGSAVVKKELREAFERDSLATELWENTYPDINVITGNCSHQHHGYNDHSKGMLALTVCKNFEEFSVCS